MIKCSGIGIIHGVVGQTENMNKKCVFKCVDTIYGEDSSKSLDLLVGGKDGLIFHPVAWNDGNGYVKLFWRRQDFEDWNTFGDTKPTGAFVDITLDQYYDDEFDSEMNDLLLKMFVEVKHPEIPLCKLAVKSFPLIADRIKFLKDHKLTVINTPVREDTKPGDISWKGNKYFVQIGSAHNKVSYYYHGSIRPEMCAKCVIINDFWA